MKEEELLKWLFHHVEEEEIAEVTDEMLDKLIASEPYLAVLFCEYQCAFRIRNMKCAQQF